MCIKEQQGKSRAELIQSIKELIEDADAIVVGAGAGLSASAGLDYNDPKLFADKYKVFQKKGYKTITEGIGHNWYVTKENATTYWGYWSNHINNIFYQPEQLKTYELLYKLIEGKKHFIITTNADGQFFKGNFDSKRVFAMQGSYGYFQCQRGCNDTIYDNREMIQKMLEGFDEENLRIREKDIPYCPSCNELLCPNLRIDQYFVEKHHMVNKEKYVGFVNSISNDKIVFLELGVGFNTPIIIRYPFEEMTRSFAGATLIRVNNSIPKVSKPIENKSIAIDMDIHHLLDSLTKMSMNQ